MAGYGNTHVDEGERGAGPAVTQRGEGGVRGEVGAGQHGGATRSRSGTVGVLGNDQGPRLDVSLGPLWWREGAWMDAHPHGPSRSTR